MAVESARKRRTPAAGALRPAPAPPRQTKPRSNAALVHELQVHQVELEMQNEELRQTQIDLAAARDRFIDLYDLAPVGYLTLDRDGTLIGANLTGAAMLGQERKALLGRRFSRYVSPADADRWHHHLVRTLKSDVSQRIELALRRRSDELFHAQLDCLLAAPKDTPPTLRVTLTDNTQRKQAEIDRRIADSAVEAGEAERRRAARELHEELGQHLSVLKMELAGLGGATDSAGREARIASMQEALDEAVAMVRRIATGLRPLMLDDLGLNAAIDWLARDTARRLGLEVSLHLVEIDPPLDERTALAMYRMVQETLVYVARHARATGVGIDMQKVSGELVLTVQGEAPDATGPPAPSKSKGASSAEATLALRDRAHLLGGQLELDDVPGRGTRVTVRLPLPGTSHAARRRRPLETR